MLRLLTIFNLIAFAGNCVMSAAVVQLLACDFVTRVKNFECMIHPEVTPDRTLKSKN